MENRTSGYVNTVSNYGWVCPICGSVYSPTTVECHKCNKSMTSSSTTIDWTGPSKITTINQDEIARYNNDGTKHKRSLIKGGN